MSLFHSLINCKCKSRSLSSNIQHYIPVVSRYYFFAFAWQEDRCRNQTCLGRVRDSCREYARRHNARTPPKSQTVFYACSKRSVDRSNKPAASALILILFSSASFLSLSITSIFASSQLIFSLSSRAD